METIISESKTEAANPPQKIELPSIENKSNSNDETIDPEFTAEKSKFPSQTSYRSELQVLPRILQAFRGEHDFERASQQSSQGKSLFEVRNR